MGVVKVEMPNLEQEPVNSDLVDLISGCLVAERCVTPYGRDSRWYAHLYPISVADRFPDPVAALSGVFGGEL